MAKAKEVKDALFQLAEFPTTYDAHNDPLSEKWDHAENVNKLLAVARTLAAALKAKK